MMTIKKLREILDQFDDNAIVIISGDHESFSPLAETSWGYYIPETDWNGDFVDSDEAEEDKKLNLNDAEQAIVLWPAN